MMESTSITSGISGPKKKSPWWLTEHTKKRSSLPNKSNPSLKHPKFTQSLNSSYLLGQQHFILESLDTMQLHTFTECLQGLATYVILHKYLDGVGLVTLTTLYWLNLSPFYLKKEDLLEKLMEKLDKKYGPDMKILNDALPRTRTTREIDRRTQQLYNERHSFLTGKLFSEEDLTPPILISHPARNYMNKKLYL